MSFFALSTSRWCQGLECRETAASVFQPELSSRLRGQNKRRRQLLLSHSSDCPNTIVQPVPDSKRAIYYLEPLGVRRNSSFITRPGGSRRSFTPRPVDGSSRSGRRGCHSSPPWEASFPPWYWDYVGIVWNLNPFKITCWGK